jgi:hypothetical protein
MIPSELRVRNIAKGHHHKKPGVEASFRFPLRENLGTGDNLFWDFGLFRPTKKNPADVNLQGFRIMEAEVGIEPA